MLLGEINSQFHSQPYLEKLYLAMFSKAYYGLLHVGEITRGTHPILAKNVHIGTNKNKILIYLESSKTHNCGNMPQTVKINEVSHHKNSKKKDRFCPFRLLRNYVNCRKGYIMLDEPFFVFHDRTPVSPTCFRAALKLSIKNCGLQDDLFNCHSFRVGRSVDLLQMGISVETIKKLHRWSAKSNAVYHYLKYT